MKKTIAIVMSLILVLSLSACGTGNNDKTAETTVDNSAVATASDGKKGDQMEVTEIVWAMQGAANESDGWTAVVETANKQLEEKNIKIAIQRINTSDWDEYYQKVTAQIAGGNCPDIGRIAESLMPTVISKKQVVDLTDLIDSDIDRSLYFDTVFNNAGMSEGRSYGLPSGVYQKIMYFNKDLFDKANLEYPSADWNNSITFSELVDTAKALSSGEGIDRTYGFYSETDIFMVGCFAGEYLYSADNTYKITDKHTTVYQMLDTMLNVDKSMPTPIETQIMSGFDMFRAGKVAMVCDGTWWQQTAREITDFNIGIAAAPSLDGKANATAFIDNYVLWSGSEHSDEAWEALKAIFSTESASVLAKTGTGGVPVNSTALENFSDELIGENFDAESKASFTQSMNNTWAMPYNENFNEISQQTNSILDSWMVGTKELDNALKELDSVLESLTK